MSYRVGFSLIPRLLPGEKVLCVREWIWGASGKSLPSYRLFFSLPPVQEGGIYVTDRRILLVIYLFRVLAFQTSFWFPGRAESETEEVIQSARTGNMPVFGKFIEIIGKDPVKRWYRGEESRVRFFIRDPQPLYSLISQAISEGGEISCKQ